MSVLESKYPTPRLSSFQASTAGSSAVFFEILSLFGAKDLRPHEAQTDASLGRREPNAHEGIEAMTRHTHTHMMNAIQ